MKAKTWERLERYFEDWGDGEYFAPEGGTQQEISAASAAVGVPFPDDYHEFLMRYGSARIGQWDIFGVRPARELVLGNWSVVVVTQSFREEQWPGTEDWAVVSIDLAGNPLGIAPDGRVWIADHDLCAKPKKGGRNFPDWGGRGVIEPYAKSFEAFLEKALKEPGY